MSKTTHKACSLTLSLLMIVNLCLPAASGALAGNVALSSTSGTSTRAADTVTLNADVDVGPTIMTDSSSKPHEVSQIRAADNGSTLAEVAVNIRTQEYEYMAGFDCYGNKLLNNTCNLKSSVASTNTQRTDFVRRNGTLIVHNHPSGSSFSAKDIYAEASWDTPCAMVISERYVYTLTPGDSGWGDPSALEEYHNQRRVFYETLTNTALASPEFNPKNLLQAPVREDDGTFAWFCENEVRAHYARNPHAYFVLDTGLWITNRTVEDVAYKFELNYQRVPFDEFDFKNFDFWSTYCRE